VHADKSVSLHFAFRILATDATMSKQPQCRNLAKQSAGITTYMYTTDTHQ